MDDTKISSYRPDVDGLRSVAIVLVVLYHCGVPGFRNGFIGVDIFFVISGFVITAGLASEIDRTGKVDVLMFWARRALRLMPAAILMVLAVLLAGQQIFTPLEYPRLVADAWATTLYRANFNFASDGSGYFEQLAPSPLLHTWSLAVEEQFYLLWPVLILIVHRLRPGSRRALRFAVAALAVVSFAVLMGSSDRNYMFYSPLTRAWEFGVGALVALKPISRRSVTRATTAIASTGGALAVVASLALIDPSRFPSPFAAVPVVGTAVLIVAGGHPHGGFAQLLGRRSLVGLGKLSYSWYLWHWPVLIFATHRAATTSWTYRLLLAVAALIPAWLTYTLVENPIRHSARIRSSARRTGIAVAACVAVAATALSVASIYDRSQLDDPLMGGLRRAQSDHENFTSDCASVDPRVVVERCAHGDVDGSRLVLVLGDSHALQWLPALDPAAEKLGLRLSFSVLGACPAIGAGAANETPGCDQRRAQIPALIDALRPDLVIVAHSLGYLGSLLESHDDTPGATQTQIWETAMFEFATSLQAQRVPLLVMLDNPRYDLDPLDCVARSRDPYACSLTRSAAESTVSLGHGAEINALARARHGRWMDPLPLVCNTQNCPLVTADGIVTYHDTHHLTTTYIATLSSAVERELEQTLRLPGQQ